jgi:hypothetical protein
MTLTIILSHVLAFLFGIGSKEVINWLWFPEYRSENHEHVGGGEFR